MTDSHEISARELVEPFIVKVLSINAARQSVEGSGICYNASEPLIITAGHLGGTQMRAFYPGNTEEDVQAQPFGRWGKGNKLFRTTERPCLWDNTDLNVRLCVVWVVYLHVGADDRDGLLY